MYEIGMFNLIIKTGLTRREARLAIEKAWNENRHVIYWRKTGTKEWYM